jgi:hypothetical protein
MKKYDLLYCIGDSFVYAIDQADDVNHEITENNRFTNLVSNHYDLKCVNHAVPGISNEYIAKKLYSDIINFKSQGINPLVFVAYTDPWRTEIYSNKNNVAATMTESTVSFFKEYLVEHHNDQYVLDRTIYNVLSVRTLLNYFSFDFIDSWVFYYSGPAGPYKNDIPYISNKQEIQEPLKDIAGVDRYILSSDNNIITYGHPNIIGHAKIANTIIEKINTLYGTR